MNNAIFGKLWKMWEKILNLQQQKGEEIILQSYHTTKFFIENLLAIKMRKTQILINKPAHLGLSILDLS